MKKRIPKLWRLLGVTIGLLLLYTITGFLLLPPIIKAQLEKRLGAELGRRVTVEKVNLNPYTLSATLTNFVIHEQDAMSPFLAWRMLYVNFDALSSLGADWVLSDIRLEGLDVRIALAPDRTANFADILQKRVRQGQAPDAAPAKPGRALQVGNLMVADARVDFSDQSRLQPFATKLGPVTFGVTNFHTTRKEGAPSNLEAMTEAGGRIAWIGTLQLQPMRSVGELRLENIPVGRFFPYFSEHAQADVTGGSLSIFGKYEVNLDTQARVLKLADGAIRMQGLKILERATQESAIELPGLEFKGINFDGLTRKGTIDAIVLSGGRIRVGRDAKGAISLQTMLQPVPRPAATSSAPAASTSLGAATTGIASDVKPDITVGQLALHDFKVDFADLAAPRPVELKLSAVEFSLRNLTLAPGAQMPLQLSFALGPKGTVQVEGEVGIAPLNADLKTTVAGLELPPLSPFVERFINARISQGEVSTTLSTQALLTDREELALTVAGDVKVEKFGLADTAQGAEFVGFDEFALQGLRASSSTSQDLAIDEIRLSRPKAHIVLNRDRHLNLVTLARTDSPTPAPAASAVPKTDSTDPAPGTPAPPSTPKPKIEIGKVTISDGDIRFTDQSIEPNVAMALNQFTGTIAGLSSINPASVPVDIKATVDGGGQVLISGKLNPLGPTKSVDLKLDFKNVDLRPLSPYVGKYAGYELARGTLLLDAKPQMEGTKVDMKTVITLNQFTFGSPVKSPDATSLPVRLGVALLKDADGRIVIDVPVQGSTDDPNFRVSRVVLRAVTNLLTKAATSPFSLLGAVFGGGGGGDELAYQEFAAGSSALQAGELKKLETMTQALKNRPALGVSLEGSYDAAADAHALKRVKVDEKVRAAIWEGKRARNPNVAAPADLVIDPEESVYVLKQLFDAQFPPGTSLGAPVPEPPKPVTPPPPPTGFFQSLIDAITQKSKREERAAEKENARLASEHQKAVDAAVARGLPYDEMRNRLAETMVVDEGDLRALAQTRARQVRDYFSQTGGIADDRLFLAKDTTEFEKPGKGPRVFLNLQ